MANSWIQEIWRRIGGFMPTRWSPSYSYWYNSTTPILIDTTDLMRVYLENPIFRWILDTKADMFSNMKIRVRDVKTGEYLDDHEVLKLLKKPNPLQTQQEWLSQYSIYKDIYANAFIYKLSGIAKPVPDALWNLMPKAVTVVPTGKLYQQTQIEEIIKEYKVSYGATDVKYKPAEVIYKADRTGDSPIVGSSKIHNLRSPLSNICGALETRNILIYKKGALGILSSDSKDDGGAIPIGDKEKIKIAEEYAKQYGIGDDQQNILITSASVKWQPMTFPTKDLMLFEEIQDDFAIICDAYGMNRNLFSTVSGSGVTYENQREARKGTYLNTIQSEADDLMISLTENFKLTEQGLELVADYSWMPLLQEDKSKEADVSQKKAQAFATLVPYIGNGFENAEELRKILNL